MQLTSIDWTIVAIYGAVTLVLGFWFTRRAVLPRLEWQRGPAEE